MADGVPIQDVSPETPKEVEHKKKPASSTFQPFMKPATIEISKLSSGITKKQLYKKARKFGTIKEIDFVDSASEAKIIFETEADALNAIKHLHDHVFKSNKIQAVLVKHKVFMVFMSHKTACRTCSFDYSKSALSVHRRRAEKGRNCLWNCRGCCNSQKGRWEAKRIRLYGIF